MRNGELRFAVFVKYARNGALLFLVQVHNSAVTTEDSHMHTRRKRIGDRFRGSRDDAQYSQEEVAQALGLTRQAVSAWEQGDRMPSTTQLGDLAALYGRSADFMIFGMKTIPVDLLKAKGDEFCLNPKKLMVGFRSLVEGWGKR